MDDSTSTGYVAFDDNNGAVNDNQFDARDLTKIEERIEKIKARKRKHADSGKLAHVLSFFIRIAQLAFIMFIDLFTDAKRFVYQCYQWVLMYFYARRVKNMCCDGVTSDRVDKIISASVGMLDITEFIRCYLRTERVISVYTLCDWISFLPGVAYGLNSDKSIILTIYSRFMQCEKDNMFDIEKHMIDLRENIDFITKKPIENLEDWIFQRCEVTALDDNFHEIDEKNSTTEDSERARIIKRVKGWHQNITKILKHH